METQETKPKKNDIQIRDIFIRSLKEKIALTVFKGKNCDVKKNPCVFFLPGTMANPYTYQEYIEGLVDHGYVVIGVNYIGHGKSDRTKEDFDIYTLKQNAIDGITYVKDNIASFGTDIYVMGHSQGGILGSLLVDQVPYVNKYILGDFLIATQPNLKKIVGLDSIPNPLIRVCQLLVKIYGHVFKSKKFGLNDYVNISPSNYDKCKDQLDEQTHEEWQKDPLVVKEYPAYMIQSLANLNTDHLVEKPVKDTIIMVVQDKDPLFTLELEKEAFDLLNAKNKKFVVVDSNDHLVYLSEPKKMADIIANLIKEQEEIEKEKAKKK